MSKMFALKPQHENETLFKYIYRSSLGLDIFISLIICGITILFTEKVNLFIPLTFFGATTILTLLLALLAGSSFSKDLSDLYLKFQIDPDVFSESDKVDILRRLCIYPNKVAVSVYISWLAAGGISIVILALKTGVNPYSFILFWIAVCGFPAIGVFSISTNICSDMAEKLAKQHFQSQDFLPYMDGKRFFGVSLNSMFISYVIMPVIACVIITLSFIMNMPRRIDTYALVRILLLIVIEIGAVAGTASFFVRGIKRENDKLYTVLLDHEKSGDRETAVFIPVNYYTDFSYTGNLINKISKRYSIILSQHESTRRRVMLASESISQNFEIISTLLDSQSDLLGGIRGKLEETRNTTQSVNDHIMENHKIAIQTKKHVEFGQESINLNIVKMDEITQANNTSVSDIKTLSREITTIWEIVNMINGIADRTKIIAFNAELEAESFESENSSFKNVAVNIRALADKIMELTKDIRSQIIILQESSHNLIIQGTEFSQRIREGNQLTMDLNEIFHEIHNSTSQTVSSSDNISILLGHIIRERELILDKIMRTEKALLKLKEASDNNKQVSEKINALSNYREIDNNETSSLMTEEK